MVEPWWHWQFGMASQSLCSVHPVDLKLICCAAVCADGLSRISPYESWPIPRPGKQAISLAVPGRRIGRVDGPDKKTLELKRNQPSVQVPLLENFAKKPSAFLKINPQSNSAG